MFLSYQLSSKNNGIFVVYVDEVGSWVEYIDGGMHLIASESPLFSYYAFVCIHFFSGGRRDRGSKRRNEEQKEQKVNLPAI